jgi:formamidopyrimidine-DNA glycosylase
MPELPEVMRITHGLAKLKGQTVHAIDVVSGRYVRHGLPQGFETFSSGLPMMVSKVTHFGKLIIIRLSGPSKEWHIASTLGMTGSWKFVEANHTRIRLSTSLGDLFFDDPRNFGTMRLISDQASLDRILKGIGPTVNRIDSKHFAERIRSVRRSIAEALMDQSCVSGVGNYIKAEALYGAGISPHRMTDSIGDAEMRKLHAKINDVVKSSFESGGASIRTFSDASGSKGSFQERFAIYGRKEAADGSKVIKETTLDGRTTFWSPKAQS